MPVEIEDHGDLVMVQLHGNIYVPDANRLRDKLFRMVDKGVTSIHINMSHLDFIDCAGVGAIISLHNRLRNHGGHLTLTGMRGSVDELFAITQIDKILTIKTINQESF